MRRRRRHFGDWRLRRRDLPSFVGFYEVFSSEFRGVVMAFNEFTLGFLSSFSSSIATSSISSRPLNYRGSNDAVPSRNSFSVLSLLFSFCFSLSEKLSIPVQCHTRVGLLGSIRHGGFTWPGFAPGSHRVCVCVCVCVCYPVVPFKGRSLDGRDAG